MLKRRELFFGRQLKGTGGVSDGKSQRSLSVIIKNSSFLREKSDYDDFFIAGKKEAEKQIEDARVFLMAVEKWLEI